MRIIFLTLQTCLQFSEEQGHREREENIVIFWLPHVFVLGYTREIENMIARSKNISKVFSLVLILLSFILAVS